jgi:hypothetical protein
MILAGTSLATMAAPTTEDISAVAVPRLTRAPVIDGVIGADEWRSAAAISGPVSQGKEIILPRPTTFFLGWDAEHFYLACRTYIRPGYKPRIPHGRSEGLASVFDDGLELVIKPQGKNLNAEDAGAAYKLFINALGHVGDLTRLELGQQLKNWGPKLKAAAQITAPGTAPDGGSWWELEMSGSLADFNQHGPNRAGDPWKIMLGINHFPVWMQARIPCTGSYFESDGAGYTRLQLVENEPAIQFTMDSLTNLTRHAVAALTVRAFNPGMQAATARVEVNVADKIIKEQDLVLPPGGQAELALNEPLPAGVTNGLLRVVAKRGEQLLLNYVGRFDTATDYSWMMGLVPPPKTNEFAFAVEFNPARNLALISGDTYYLPNPAAAKQLDFTIKSAAGQTLASGVITNVAEWYLRDFVTLPNLPPGKHTAEATLTLKDGTILGPMTNTIEKLDEAQAFPAWWGKNFGNVERVLPPFTALRRQGNRVSCWGREYTLSALGLPAALVSQGQPVLAAPARIVVTRAGREEVVPLGPAEITEATDWRVRFTGKARGAGLDFHAQGWIEQDGLVYVELTYTPQGGQPVKVDALRLEFPVANAEAEGLLCIGPGNNFSSHTAKLLPRQPRGRLWSTLETGRTGSGMTVGSFYPTVWIGNDRRGLLWWADNDQGWFPDDEVPAHEAVRADAKAVVLRNNLIGKPVTVDGAHTVRFSYNATPFKPLLAGWRSWAAKEDGTFFTPHRSLRKDSQTGEPVNKGGRQRNWIHPESRYPEEWSDLWARQKTNTVELGFPGADAYARARLPFDPYAARNGREWGHMSFALHGYGEKTLEGHLYKYFGAEWQTDIETWNPSFVDYAMYLFSRAFREGGVHSTYWDLTFPILSQNLIGGLAYRLPDGRLQRGYNGWNQRHFFMRLHALADENGLLPGCNGVHSTHAYVLVAIPWVDAVLDGERNWNLDLSDNDWTDYYRQERMRVMSSPHNWGLGICWMGNLDTKDRAKRSLGKIKQGEYVWMFDSWINPYVSPGPTRMPEPALDWGLNSADAIYVPYWRNELARPDNPNVLVSVWRMPGEGRALFGIYNYDRAKTNDVTIKLNLRGLNLPAGDWLMRDLYQPVGEASQFDPRKGTLRVTGLAPHRIRLVGLGTIPPAARRQAEQALPAWVTNGVPPEVIDYGMVRAETRYFAPGQAASVSCTNNNIQVGMWQLPDRVVLSVFNAGPKAADAELAVDLAGLGLKIKPWQEFLRVRTWLIPEKAAEATLNYYGNTLTLKALPPNQGRLVAIRKY